MWARALPASPKRPTSPSQPIKWASHAEPVAVEHRRIDHRGAHIAVPEQLLNRANVVPWERALADMVRHRSAHAKSARRRVSALSRAARGFSRHARRRAGAQRPRRSASETSFRPWGRRRKDVRAPLPPRNRATFARECEPREWRVSSKRTLDTAAALRVLGRPTSARDRGRPRCRPPRRRPS